MLRFASLVLATVVSMSATAAAGIINLGTANSYNVFVFGNDTQSGTDAEGKVAVGGNANFQNGYTVGSRATDSQGTNLVVRGDYSNTNNTIVGSAVVGGNATINNPTINGNLNVNGNVTFSSYGTVNGNLTYAGTLANPHTTISGTTAKGTTALPVDFDSERSKLTTLSANLAKTVGYTYGNGVTYQYGGFTLTGTASDLNIFTIKGSDLASANSFSINARSGSTVVINVDGTADQMQNFGFSITGTDRQHVLFNFSQATTLTLSGVGVQGSILAPLAAINFAGGSIDGTIIGASISGAGESHNYQFLGDLSAAPGVSNSGVTTYAGAVPEPASLLSTTMGLGLVAGMLVRRRRGRPSRN